MQIKGYYFLRLLFLVSFIFQLLTPLNLIYIMDFMARRHFEISGVKTE